MDYWQVQNFNQLSKHLLETVERSLSDLIRLIFQHLHVYCYKELKLEESIEIFNSFQCN